MKKFFRASILALIITFGSTFNSNVNSQEFIWGYTMEIQPCSQWLAIYQTICIASQGGFCQRSAQEACPGPPYFAEK